MGRLLGPGPWAGPWLNCLVMCVTGAQECDRRVLERVCNAAYLSRSGTIVMRHTCRVLVIPRSRDVDFASQQNKTKQNAAILRAVGSITRREVGPHFVLFCFFFSMDFGWFSHGSHREID